MEKVASKVKNWLPLVSRDVTVRPYWWFSNCYLGIGSTACNCCKVLPRRCFIPMNWVTQLFYGLLLFIIRAMQYRINCSSIQICLLVKKCRKVRLKTIIAVNPLAYYMNYRKILLNWCKSDWENVEMDSPCRYKSSTSSQIQNTEKWKPFSGNCQFEIEWSHIQTRKMLLFKVNSKFIKFSMCFAAKKKQYSS